MEEQDEAFEQPAEAAADEWGNTAGVTAGGDGDALLEFDQQEIGDWADLQVEDGTTQQFGVDQQQAAQGMQQGGMQQGMQQGMQGMQQGGMQGMQQGGQVYQNQQAFDPNQQMGQQYNFPPEEPVTDW